MSVLSSWIPPDTGEVYSTEETRIGTWIDGKPLYRKAGYFNMPIYPTFDIVEVDLSNFISQYTDKLIDFKLTGQSNTYLVYPFGVLRDVNLNFENHTDSPAVLKLVINSASLYDSVKYGTFNFITKYTKTTN